MKPTSSPRRSRKSARRFYRPWAEHLETRLVPSNVDVLRSHADIPSVPNYPNGQFLTAQNLQETTLTPANVNATSFGTLFSSGIDGQAYAQPLYKSNLAIPGMGTHNVAFVATEHDSVYAFDADSGAQLWHDSFIDPAHGITTIPYQELSTPDLFPEIGITGTPVIDPGTNTLYVVVKTKEIRTDGGVHYVQKLHALDLATGADRPNSPYTIGDTHVASAGATPVFANETTAIMVPGVGSESSGGANSMVPFSAEKEDNRMSLTLIGNTVYIAWASHADFRPYHGWVVGFDKTTLQPVKIFNTAPNADGVAIWESGGGLSYDGRYLYFAVGNGFQLTGGFSPFDPAHGNYSESVLKIDTMAAGTIMPVVDYFTPFNWQQLDAQDADLGSGGVMMLPDSVGSAAHPHLMIETGKQGHIYLIDRDNMGKFTPNGPDSVVQTVTAGQAGVWGNPAYAQIDATDGIIYYHGSNDVLKGYYVHNGRIEDGTMPGDRAVLHAPQSTFSHFPGTQPSVSADGTGNPMMPVNGIVWELQVDNAAGRIQGVSDNTAAGPATLRAFSTTNLNTELYDSSQTGQRDFFGGSVKFTVAVVTNGHVLAAGADHFSVLGLFPQETTAPAAPSNLVGALQSTPQGPQIHLNWTNPAPNPGHDPTGIQIWRSTDGTNFTLYNTVNRNLTTFTDTGSFQFGQRYYYEVRAVNQAGNSGFSNAVNVLVPIPPSILTITGTGTSLISLSWTPVTNDHYVIERSTDGTTFNPVATVPAFVTSYTDTGLSPGLYTYRIHAFSGSVDSFSNAPAAWVGSTIDHSTGFGNGTDLTINGSAFAGGNLLELTTATNQAGSAFSNTRFAVENFTTSFQVRLHEGTQPNYADGFTFVLQANAPTALGQSGGGIGYQGITNSVAIKFDTYDNEGEQNPDETMTGGSTGLFYGGDRPTIPHSGFPGEVNIELDRTQVNLLSQSTKRITLTYTYNPSNPNASVLHETILDPDHGTMPEFTHDYMVNIPQLLGSDTAYVGITGASGSGGFYELEDILTWQFTSQAPLPGAPTNLRQTGSTSSAVDLAWNSNSFNQTGYQVERSFDGTNYTVLGTTTVPTFEDVGLANGTYFYRVKALGASASSPYSNALQVGLPSPILTQHQDIGTAGDPSVTGNATFANNTYTLTGSGSDVWDTNDHFQFLYSPFVGDGEVVARVVTEGFANASTKAGVMIRESLAANAKNAFTLEFPQQGRNAPTFQWRPATGATTQEDGPAAQMSPPIWLRVVRAGNAVSGYYAHDNGDGTHGAWVLLGTETVIMAPSVFFGLAVTSHSNGTTITATFDHVQLLPAVQQTSHLDVSPSAFIVSPGTPVMITVKALDQFNNVVAGYRGTVHFSSPDAMDMLPANYTFTAADNGVHTFTVMLSQTLGRHTITVTDTATGAVQGGTAVTETNMAIPSSLLLTGFPSPVRTGVQGRFTVTARDAMGNTLTGYRGTVHFTSSDPRAQLPADYTFTAADNGTHVFMATLNTPGTQSLTASDSTFGVSGSQSGIQVAAPPAITSIRRSSAILAAGGTLTVSGTLADAATGLTHQVVVSWGDNSTNTTLSLAAGVFTFTANHAYTQTGNFAIQVTLTSADNISDAVTLPVTAAAIVPPAGLVGWWTGDGNNLTTAPDIAGTNPGALNGGVTYAAGKVGNAFNFDGNANRGSYVNVPDSSSLNSTTGTWDFWVKTTQSGSYVGFVGKADATTSLNGIIMQMDPTGLPRLEIKNGSQNTMLLGTTRLNDNQWHHFALTFQSGGPAVMYVDGQVQATGTAPAFTFNPNPLRFGTQLDTFWAPYNGLLDEVQIFNRVLSAAEIQAINNAGAAGQIKGVRVQAIQPVAITTVSRSASVLTEGSTLIVSGTFADPVAGQTHQAVVNWGDNSTNTTLSLAAGVFTFTANHAYTRAGNFAIQITLTSLDGTSDTVTLPVTAAAIVPPANLVGWWTGDGSSPTIAPDLAGTNPGTLNGGVTYAAGKVGNAFRFDGNANHGSYVNIPDAPGLDSSTGTWDFWLNTTQNQQYVGLVGKSDAASSVNGITMQLFQGHARVEVKGPGPTLLLEPTTPLLNDGQWHQMALTFQSGGTVVLYIDGQALATGTAPTFSFGANDPLRFGVMTDGFWTPYNGLLDEVQVFNRALSATEVQAIFGAGAGGLIKGVRVLSPHLVITGFASPTTAGTAGTFTVTVQDAFGSTATGYRGTVHFTSSDGQAGLPADYTFTAADNGVHTFMATLKTAGTQSITATDTVESSNTGTQSGIVVNPAATSRLVVSGFPSPTTAGNLGGVLVTAQDAYGNVTPGYTGTVHLTSSDGQAALQGDHTFTAADNGRYAFGATLFTAGTQSITATDTANAALTGTQSGIVVNAAAAVTLTVSDFPSPTTAGDSAEVTVTLLDPYGNVASGYTGTVSFTSSDPQAGLPADYTFTAADAGQHTFTVTLFTAGIQSLGVFDVNNAALASEQDGIEVDPAAASVLVVSGFPSPVTAGTPGTFTVTVLDPYGNVVTNYAGTLAFFSSDGQASVPDNYTFTPDDQGSHTFTATLFTAGTQVLGAIDIQNLQVVGLQQDIQVLPAAASTLQVSGFPSPVQAGTPGRFVVTALDPYGNVATGYTGTIHFYSSDDQAGLPADYTFTVSDGGAHLFTATLNTPGTQVIGALDMDNGVFGEQDGIEVTAPGPAGAGNGSQRELGQSLVAAVDGHSAVLTWAASNVTSSRSSVEEGSRLVLTNPNSESAGDDLPSQAGTESGSTGTVDLVLADWDGGLIPGSWVDDLVRNRLG